MSASPSQRAAYWPAAAIFLCAWVVLCWPWLSGAVTIPFDAKAHFQAQIQFLAQALHSGQSPFWTHNVFGGSPQIADPQSMIFSPAIILAWLFPSPSFRAVDAYVLLHLLGGGYCLMLYGRDRGWHPAAGLLAALVFAFGASAAWRVQHVGQIASLAFFALSFWLTARMLDRNTILSGVLAGSAAGLMVLEPDQVALLGAYVIVGMVVGHWLAGGRAAVMRSILPGTAATLAAVAVVALPLLWTWLFADGTTRPAVDLAEAGRGSLHPASLLTGFIGDLFGARDPAVDFWGPYTPNWANDLFLSQNMGQVYAGALPALLLLAPGLSRGWLFARGVRTLTVLFGLMILFALGRYTPFFQLAYDWLPGVKAFRRPADATFLIGALGAVLAGHMLHRLLTEGSGPHRRRDLAVLLVALTVLGGGTLWLASAHGHLAEASGPVLKALGWAALSLAALALVVRRGRALGPALACLVLAGAVSADLRANNGPNESTALDPAIYDVLRPETANETVRVLKELVAQPANSPRRDRVELLGLGFEWPNAGLVHGFDHTLGYNPLRLADFSDAVGTRDSIASAEDRRFTPLFPGYRCRLADFLGLRYIATKVPVGQIDGKLQANDLRLVAQTRDGFIYENPRALPRVQFVGGWQLADFDAMKAAGQWPEVDPNQAILIEQEPGPLVPEGVRAVKAEVALASYRNTEVEIAVTAEKPGFVVLNDIWHPWWQATVDGEPTEILKANVLFRAVPVPAGRHVVRFSFHPVEGAIAQLREKIAPSEEIEDPLDRPEEAPLVAGAPPRLAGPQGGLGEALRVTPAPAQGAAAAQAQGEVGFELR